MGVLTPNLNLNKPTLFGDTGIWGSLLNDNFDILDTQIPGLIAQAISDLVDGSPATLDTLNEIASALNDDASHTATILAQLALKAPIASPVFTGIPTAPTPLISDDSTQIATTNFVKNNLVGIGSGVYDAIVDAGGGGDYLTIQSATSTELEGARIYIKNGLYQPGLNNIVVKNGQKLIGESREGVIVDYQTNAKGFVIGNHSGVISVKAETSISDGSATITGTWLDTDINVGDIVYYKGSAYIILTVGINIATLTQVVYTQGVYGSVSFYLSPHKNIELRNITIKGGASTIPNVHLKHIVQSIFDNINIIDSTSTTGIKLEQILQCEININKIENCQNASGIWVDASSSNSSHISKITIKECKNNRADLLRLGTSDLNDIEVNGDYQRIIFISGDNNRIKIFTKTLASSGELNHVQVGGYKNTININYVGKLTVGGTLNSIFVSQIQNIQANGDYYCSVHGARIDTGSILAGSQNLLLIGCKIDNVAVTRAGIGTNTVSSIIY
jgi:hypothetical protein